MIGRLRARLARDETAAPELGAPKRRAIDHACEVAGCEALADLGGVWAVEGGYALYAIDRHGASRAVICDDDFTPALEARAAGDPRLELVRGNFGRQETVAAVGDVDAILLFDVLLHQVAPDWDEVLAMYAASTGAFVVAGPWWNGERTVRLVELGRDAYLDAVPLRDFHADAWDRLDEVNPRRGRPWRDCHDIWQWGITEDDLVARMADLGFGLSHREHTGPWRGLDRFDEIAFVFRRDG